MSSSQADETRVKVKATWAGRKECPLNVTNVSGEPQTITLEIAHEPRHDRVITLNVTTEKQKHKFVTMKVTKLRPNWRLP